MSRTLFWEEGDVPGRTQLTAAITNSELVNKVTFYDIEVRVSTASYDGSAPAEKRTWTVLRRYRDFDSLYTALRDLGFPSPSLPPKQLWWGHTNAFMEKRQMALDCWIQGVVIIWQSVAPSRPRVAYAIGELLEAFLCAPDSDSFHKVVEEVQHEEKTATDHDPEFDSQLPTLGLTTIAEMPLSPFVTHVASEKTKSPTLTSGNQQEGGSIPRSASTNSFAQVAQQKKRRSKRTSGTGPIAEEDSSSFSDVSGLKSNLPSSYEDQEKISRSAPPESGPNNLGQSMPTTKPEWQQPTVPTSSAVGIAVNVISSSSPSSQKHRYEYVTFNTEGRLVRRCFEPYTAEVVFGEGHEGREEVIRSSGLLGANTPVSVPPSPQAQNLFNVQWNQYTSSVLDFVEERLSIVSRNKERRDFNILDRHYPGNDTGVNQMSDNEEEDRSENAANAAPRQLTVINLRERPSQQSDAEVVEDADAGAGGSAQGGLQPPKHALAASYVIAGEHLIKTILKEAEADLLDWQFVSNTKDVIVMRRLRPIKRKNLLKVKGPSIQQPSPSPNITDDKIRGNVALAPSMLTLDGASSVASSLASPMPQSSEMDMEMSQHCFMGRGIIDATAEEIFEIVRRPEKRPLYDSMLNEELLLENLCVGDCAHEFESTGMGNLLVYYHLFETNRCFLRYARDFCVLQYAKKVTVGKQTKYVVVGASINHGQCPVREDVERATLDLFGWVIEPTNKSRQSKVTCMVHIDFGRSGVPTHLLNTISFRQPLAVHYLRRYIRSIPPEERGDRGRAQAQAQAQAQALKDELKVSEVKATINRHGTA